MSRRIRTNKQWDAQRRALESRIRLQKQHIKNIEARHSALSISYGEALGLINQLRSELKDKHIPGYRQVMDYLALRAWCTVIGFSKGFKDLSFLKEDGRP